MGQRKKKSQRRPEVTRPAITCVRLKMIATTPVDASKVKVLLFTIAEKNIIILNEKKTLYLT